jgi:hypothetical protein
MGLPLNSVELTHGNVVLNALQIEFGKDKRPGINTLTSFCLITYVAQDCTYHGCHGPRWHHPAFRQE